MQKVLHIHCGKEGGAERFFVSLAQALAERGIEQRFAIRPGRTWRAGVAGIGPVLEDHCRPLSLRRPWLRMRLHAWRREWRPNAIFAWRPRSARLLPGGSVDCLRVGRLGDYPESLRPWSRCDVLVCNAPGIAMRCRELGWGGRLEIASNFPPPPPAKRLCRAEAGTPEDAFVVAGMGRFVPRKGFDVLLQAVARLPGAWLWLVGEGEEGAGLRALAVELGIGERVRFFGWEAEPLRIIAAADALGVPSRHEPLGNVVLEAWGVGVPVVSTRSEGPSWCIKDGRSGLLVDVDDAEGLAAALGALQGDPERRRRLTEGGRARLAETFNRERIVDQYLGILASTETGTPA